MKKIAVLLDCFSVGGIPKVCLSFLNILKDEFNVSLLVFDITGELQCLIPDSVKIKQLVQYNPKDIFRELLGNHHFLKAFYFLFKYAYLSRFCNYIKTCEYIKKTVGYLDDDDYDLAIAFHGMNVSQLFTVLFQINAKKKVAWIHGSRPFSNKEKAIINKYYEMFDKIFCVSQATMENFLIDYPSCKDITGVYYNHIECDLIKQKANEKTENLFNKTFINIVTAGRISKEKGQELIPPIVSLLANKIDVCWYIVGDGPDIERIKKIALEYKVENNIVFVGNKINPYPFINGCDIYVQPSYEEGYSTTICEAGTLGKVIIGTTVSGGIREQIDNGINGIIVNPTVKDLYNAIIEVIENKQLKKNLEKNIKLKDFSNAKEIEKIRTLLNNE